MAGAAHDNVVHHRHPDGFQGLGDLVGGVGVLLGGIRLLSGVTPELPLAQLAGSILRT